MFTWGFAGDGRLGHPDTTIKVSNGDVTRDVTVCERYPRQVQHFAERIVTKVACSRAATVAVATCMLEAMVPINGPTSGGTRIKYVSAHRCSARNG